jgi:hypothetical protein
VYAAISPTIRGFQWIVLMAHGAAGLPEVPLPPDTGQEGVVVYPEPRSG